MFPFQNILFATDLFEASENAFNQTIQFVNGNSVQLHLFHVIQPPQPDATEWESFSPTENTLQSISERTQFQLNHLQASLPSNITSKTAWEFHFAPADAIIHYASEQDIDLIIVGTHSRKGVRRFLLGSVAEAVARHAQCPVLILPHSDADLNKRENILVPVDFSERALKALPLANTLVEDASAKLHMLHVLDDAKVFPVIYGVEPIILRNDDVQKEILEKLRAVAKEYVPQTSAEIHLVIGEPRSTLTHFIEKNPIDLVVMTTHGYTGAKRLLLGSVAEYTLRHIHVPLLILRSF